MRLEGMTNPPFTDLNIGDSCNARTLTNQENLQIMPPIDTAAALSSEFSSRLLERASQEARSISMVSGEEYHTILSPRAGSPFGGPGSIGPVATVVLPPTLSLNTGTINFPGGLSLIHI